MASIVVTGDTSGAITIAAPAVAGTNTLTLPASTGTLVVTGGAQTIEFADGSAAAPSITNSGDTNTGIFFPAADTIAFTEGGVESMRIDSSGNVGIGVTPSASSATALQVGARGIFYQGGDAGPVLANNLFNDGSNKYITTGFATAYQQNAAGLHIWYTAPSGTGGTGASLTETMRIDSSGNLLVGDTSAVDNSKLLVSQTGNKACIAALTTSAGGSAVIRVQTSQSSMTAMYMLTGGGGTVAGIISSSGSSTTYGTSSDYRLKENITPMTGALDKVSKLKPITYKWKADGIDGQGFIAHELAEVCPDAVVGKKDAVNEDGTIKPQAIDPSKLVATLTAAIQELKAELDTVKVTVEAQAVRIAELEGAK